MSEPKLCPVLMIASRILMQRPDEAVSLCLQDKCEMWRTSEVMIKRPELNSTAVYPAEYQPVFYCGLAGKP